MYVAFLCIFYDALRVLHCKKCVPTEGGESKFRRPAQQQLPPLRACHGRAVSLVLRVTRRALLLLRPFNHANARSGQVEGGGRFDLATGGRKGGGAKICPPGANPLSLIHFQGLADTMARYRNITSSQRDGFIKSLNNSILRATVVKWRGLETSSTCEVHVITLPFPAKVILN